MSFSKPKPTTTTTTTTNKKTFKNKCPRVGEKRYVDMLKQNPPISNQAWGVFSYVMPVDVIKRKELFYFQQFLKTWDINKSMEKYSDFTHFLVHKYNLNSEQVMGDYHEFMEEERTKIIQETSLTDDYINFLEKNQETLDNKFNQDNEFQTSVICFKAEGNYATETEAKLRAKLMREFDDAVNHHVAPIGVWVPLVEDVFINPEKMSVIYLEEEMNELMSQKIKNQEKAKSDFEARKNESKEKAMEENRKRTELYGGKLTQTLENGELVGIAGTNTTEKALAETNTNNMPIDLKKLENLLFEGENIVTDKKTDHGQSQLLSGPFKINS
jgi:hypothetical protein